MRFWRKYFSYASSWSHPHPSHKRTSSSQSPLFKIIVREEQLLTEIVKLKKVVISILKTFKSKECTVPSMMMCKIVKINLNQQFIECLVILDQN